MSTPANRRQEAVSPQELDVWVRFVYNAAEEHRDAPDHGVAPAVIAAEAAADGRHRATVHRNLKADHRVEAAIGIGPRGERTTFVPASEAEVDIGDGIETDGGSDRVRVRDEIVAGVLSGNRPSEQLRESLGGNR